MNNVSDSYLTPEQVADRLQLGVETVYRWLRSRKLRGSRISHKAWRVPQRELESFLKKQNVSELLFEEYLLEYQLGTPEHEPPYPGATRRVDYRLQYKGKMLWFEVKEFAEDRSLFTSKGGAFDPHLQIRRMIEKAVKKFRDYDNECCSLVLFNESYNLVDICTPRIVLGAMLGSVGFRIPINIETGEEVGPITNIFTDGGKLIHPHIKKPINRTISAVIALQRFPIGQKEFNIELAQIEKEEQRIIELDEHLRMLAEHRESYDRQVLRAIVYENPHATNPLPRDIFVGPFDERWGQEDEVIKPVVVGIELEKLRQAERELELDIPFRKQIKRGMSRQPWKKFNKTSS